MADDATQNFRLFFLGGSGVVDKRGDNWKCNASYNHNNIFNTLFKPFFSQIWSVKLYNLSPTAFLLGCFFWLNKNIQ